jgi:creatinine amidohydrolase
MKYWLAIGLMIFSFAARAQEESVYLEDLTWPEVKARMAQGAQTIIIPTGGTEQNGPAIVIGKHNKIVKYTSGEIARTLGNALVAPVIAYVPEGAITPPEGHMQFPGTISVTEAHLAAILEDAARSFKQQGFRRICFIGDHGGNQKAQAQVADKLSAEWKGEGVTVLHVGDYYADKAAMEWAMNEKLGGDDPSAHAGFMDASEAMAVDGKAVRPALLISQDKKDSAATGVLGDPAKASASYGKKLLAFKVKAAVEQIRRTP